MAQHFLPGCVRKFKIHNLSERIVISPALGHAIAAAVFLLLSVIALREFLFGNSFYIYRDVVWPTMNVDLLSRSLFSLDLESTRRIIFLGPFFLATQLFGVSSLVAEKTFFFLIKFLIGFFAYIGVYHFLCSKIKHGNKTTCFLIALFAGYFYAYNPAATSMVSPTFFFAFSYSLIPLVFYFFDKALTEKGFFNIFMASTLITLCIAGVTQLLVILPVFLLIPWFIVVCVKRGKSMVFDTIKKFSYILIISFLMSSYYIIVALSMYVEGVTLQPSYVITYDFLNLISQKTNLLDVIRLMGDWWPRIELVPIIDNTVWLALTFAIPIAAGLFILFSRKTELKFYILSLSIIALLVIFVHKGTSPPFSEFYLALYDLPVVGWMFRIPSKFAMILAFYVTMILSLGFYNLLAPKYSNKIKAYFKYGLFVGFVICISVISWPMFTGDLGGIYKDGEYPEIESTMQGNNNNDNIKLINIPQETIAISGGLEKLASLNSLESFKKANSSLIFTDQSLNTNLNNMTGIDKLVLSDSSNDLAMHLLPKDTLVIEPFDATKRHNPKSVWSVAGTNDPIQGPFHSYLDMFSISNSDIDYGKGLVFTWSNDKLEIPIKVVESDLYSLNIRYLRSEQGGSMKVYLDNNLIGTVNTLEKENSFAWKNIGTVNLTSGTHTLTLENIRGLNVVNIFALVPSRTIFSDIMNKLDIVAQKPRNIQILDAKASFHATENYNGNNSIFISPKGTFNETIEKELQIPANTDSLSLQFLARQNPTGPSSYEIRSFEVEPVTNSKQISFSDFENTMKELSIYSSSGDNRISIETKDPISGLKSLKVELNGDPVSSSWNSVTSEPIALNSTAMLNFGLTVSAIDTNSLHSKVKYYDSSGQEIGTNYIFFSPSNNFHNTFSKSVTVPKETKFVTLQLLARPNSQGAGSYLIDDIRIEEIYPAKIIRNAFEYFGNSHIDENQKIVVTDNSLKVGLEQGNTTDWNIVQSEPIKVTAGLKYKYKLHVQADNINTFESKVLYSTEKIENSNKNGIEDGVLLMSPGSEVSAPLGLLKESLYTTATRAKTCPNCTSIIIKVGDVTKELSLNNNKTELKWLYFTTNLSSESTDIRVYSKGQTELEKVVVYSDSYENETLDSLFATPSGKKASVSAYEKINPIKYNIKINSQEPFMLQFDEPFHPLWRVSSNGKEYKPVQVYLGSGRQSQSIVGTNYPAINGFIIDQTGELNLTIEYKPLKWLLVGAVISSLAFTILLGYLLWERREKIASLFKLTYRRVVHLPLTDTKNEGI